MSMIMIDGTVELAGFIRVIALRNMLDRACIEWWDDTDLELRISRTKFEYGGREHSVIYGPYSYGYEQGLLEYWDHDKEEPKGYFTEEEIMERIKAI